MNIIDSQMTELELEVIKTGGYVKDNLANLMSFIKDPQDSHQETAQEFYDVVKMYCRGVENRCVKILIHQQPVARDLRRIKAIMNIIIDYQRIADQALHIISTGINLSKMELVWNMAEKAGNMVKNAITAFLKGDQPAAMLVIEGDDEVDKLFLKIKYDLIGRIRQGTTNDDDWIIDCLLSIKYLERIGDHAVNIAKEV